MGTERRWSIGELAEEAGLTIRTLRHYDQIGLLPAAERTGSGHRRYSQNDLVRLLRIRSLRRLGLSLENIGRVLRAPADDSQALQEVLRAELVRLESRASEMADTIERVRNLLNEPDSLPRNMEVHTMLEGYLTDEQKQRIIERRDKLGVMQDNGLRLEWVGLFKSLSEKLEAGTPAGDPEVQAMAVRWGEIGTSYTGTDPDIMESARRLWEENQEAVSEHVSRAIGFDPLKFPAVVAYVEEARVLRSS